jgi:hypothetical protein
MYISGVDMANEVLTDEIKQALLEFLGQNKALELVGTYLYYLERQYKVNPVLFVRDRTIFRSADEVIRQLENEGKLWHETEIAITFGEESVNDQSRKIYICPFTGKVFGDNTHPNPQDAIYDWVSNCPQNTERVNGLRVKRFYVSEDPEVIKSYLDKHPPQEMIKKKVFSSALSGKLFSSKNAVIDDFKKNYLKPMSLVEAQGQNRYKIEENLLNFIQEKLTEDQVTTFVETVAEHEEFSPYVEKWIEE